MRQALARLNYFCTGIMTSGPLMTLLFFSIPCILADPQSFGPGHTAMFSFASPLVWGLFALVAPILGYYGLFTRNRSLWLWAHAGACMVLFAIGTAFYFTYFKNSLGGPTDGGLALGAGLNAFLRAEDNYKDPFPK